MDFHPTSWADLDPDKFDEMQELARRGDSFTRFRAEKRRGALVISVSSATPGGPHVSAEARWYGMGSALCDDKKTSETLHPSFELYKRKTFIQRQSGNSLEQTTFFDVESDPNYEGANPGTITIEGFGLECWALKITWWGKFIQSVRVSTSPNPTIPLAGLLRRLDELRRSPGLLGQDSVQDELDLIDLVGDMGRQYGMRSSGHQPGWWIEMLYTKLNRADMSSPFIDGRTVSERWAGPLQRSDQQKELVFREILVAKELARRLDKYGEQATSQDLTPQILGALIAADLWVQNVSIVLGDKDINTASLADPITPEERSDAEALKRLGNDATYGHDYPRALSMYSQAIKIDSGNAIYRSNRSAAYCALDQFEEAAEDAYIAVKIDPTYAKAWARLGMAYMKLNRSKKARKCYSRAVELAGPDVTETMKRGLAEAEAKIKAALAKVADGDKVTQSRAGKAILDQDWDLTLKTVRFHSLVHEQQVAGLVLFAQQMNWPYIDEVRDCVDKLYSRILAGEAVSPHLQDWIYGVALPGKFLALTIMSTLILCTPSISKTLKLSASWDWGLSLPQHSYWRTRTALGRVLGALPGVKSLNGWIGPCPAVEFMPPVKDAAGPRHIQLKAQVIHSLWFENVCPGAPLPRFGAEDDSFLFADEDITEPGPYDDRDLWQAQMSNHDFWIVPITPGRRPTTCELKSIQLEQVPIDRDPTHLLPKWLQGVGVESSIQWEYRANLVFQLSSEKPAVRYTLNTNPVFVTLPPCSGGPHRVHMQAFARYSHWYTVERLRHEQPPALMQPDRPFVVNATGKGEELLARAWCAQWGRNAVVRTEGGPCFACAVRSAGRSGLGFGVLIWA